MKKLLLFTIGLSIILSCSSRKQAERSINSGNYDQAINIALDNLRTNKTKKRNQDYVYMLQEAYDKVVDRDLTAINHLKKDNNPELYREIYEIYLDLNARQESIKPLLPLLVNGKKITFKITDYSDAIVQSRATVSDYMYEKGLDLLDKENKVDIRNAYFTFKYIESINPNYEKTRDFMREAHDRGTSYVSVTIQNQTNQVIPRRLEDDLLNFDTYGLNQFWTVYHAQPNKDFIYDYDMQLQLKQINISPEQFNERQLVKNKQIVDGWKYQLDRNGNVVKDSLGKDIKIDKIINVKALFSEYTQLKSTQVVANVVYVDVKSNQLVDSFSIDSEFIFENLYAYVIGDKRALEVEEVRILNNRRIPFPSNEQMVYDTGEDLKLKLKNIITSYKVRS